MLSKALFVLGPVAMLLGAWQSGLGVIVIGLLWLALAFACNQHGRTLRAAMKSASDDGEESTSGVTVPMVVTGSVLYLLAGVPALVVGLNQWEIGDEPGLRWLLIVVGGAVTALAVTSALLYGLGSALQAKAGPVPTVPAELVVVSSQQTGTYINEMPRIEFEFDVTPEGQSTYRVTKKATVPLTALGAVIPGSRFKAKVSGPDEPTNMEIDWASGTLPTAEPTADRLRELDELKEQGLISDDEHAAQRARIIDTI